MTNPPSSQGVYDEMKDFEKRCNDRASPLNAYLVLYTTINDKKETVVRKTVMVCPSTAHVVVRFPTSVKIELLSDGFVSIVPVIAQEMPEKVDISPDAPKAKDTRNVVPEVQAPPPKPTPAPIIVAPVGAPAQAAPVKAPTVQVGDPAQARRVPLLPGLQLCRVCAFSPFTNPSQCCSSVPKGHRFDKDPATKRCEQFRFPL